MKFFLFAVALALSAAQSTHGAHAQKMTGAGRVLIDKILVDGCIVGPIPDNQP